MQAGPAQANLAIPPSDALVRADPNAPPDPNDEYDVGPGGVRSTPEELHSMPAPGIDAPKTAAGLEADLQTAKTQPNTMWRGQFGADGVDIVNVQGTLCTGLGNSSSGVHAARITLACSDGRVGQLQVVGAGGFSRVFFGSASEAVEMN